MCHLVGEEKQRAFDVEDLRANTRIIVLWTSNRTRNERAEWIDLSENRDKLCDDV